ncbi:hypothetical protein HKD37_15G043455 [Glycine soja]
MRLLREMSSRKRKSGGSRPTTQYDTRRFHSFEAWTRYTNNVLGRHILAERKVEIYHTELDEFKGELERRNFHKRLTNLADTSIDLTLVKEIYANLYSPGGPSPKQVRIRGHLIRIDADNLNDFLETPVVLAEGESLPAYSRYCRMPTDTREIETALCIPGRGFILNAEGRPGKILRKDLTTLAQVWSVLSYSNLAPNSHTSDLTVDRARLIFGLVTQLDMNVGALISGQITSMAQSNSSRLGFPTLITTLCKIRGVTSDSLVFERLSPGARRPRARLVETPSTSAAAHPASTSAAPPPARITTAPSTPPTADFQHFKAMLRSIHQGDDEDPAAQVPHQPSDESSESSTPEPLIRKRRVVLTKEAVATPEKSPEATLEPPTPMADTTSPQQAANPSTPEVQTTQSCLQTLLP